MASRSNQYIFGEFSPDEFNQFFVTPRCFVELPPFNDKVSCISHSSGEDFQHIEFGVDEVMDSEPVGVNPMYKVSSTLNPQAPEFILGCQPSQKAMPTAMPEPDVPDGTDFNSMDCQDSEPSAMDSAQACQEMDGMGGSLGQRERKKKKKRPPGYYNYLEGSGGSHSSGAMSDGPLSSGLVNGHSLGTPSLTSEDTSPEGLSGAELGTPSPTTTPSVASATTTTTPTAAPAHQRTCASPDESGADESGAASSSSDGNNAASSSSSSSSSSSQSGAVADGRRTAEQPAERPELLVGGGHSPCPTSPPPLLADAASPLAAATAATTEEKEEEVTDSGVANGLAGPGSADGHEDDSGAGAPQSSPALAVPPAGAQPLAEQPAAPAAPTAPVAPSANPPKSWASLFKNSKPLPGGPQAYVEVKNVPAVTASSPAAAEVPEKAGEVRESPVPMSEDPMAPKLAELIENVKLIHKPVSLQPRGLINKGNWCYINATLQALIACPPMYHLMKSIPLFSETQRPCTSTPMMDNFVRLVNEFSNMPVPSKAKLQGAGEKVIKDIRPGVPFEPTYIYRLLTLIKSSLSEKGRQEDAEEYLGFTLNGLHEEMLALRKLISPTEEKESTPNGPDSQQGLADESAEKDEEEGSDDEWEQVGPRNKTSITRQTDFIRTPITDIFGGHIRSVVYQQSSKESATLQPFFTLQLDIQSEKIRTVQEALETLVARESVQGYTTKTKQEIEISRRVTLEELPPVLVLHLKRFVFEKTGGCQKLVKNIDYPVDLEISKDLLSPGVRGKIFKGQRTYRLFAVVYHHGNSATGGHYTTDVFHIGLNGWLRIDDQAVKVINQYQVVKQTAERTAYLLYYRRVDLL
ncbi:ubiquitin carboxyl-terminal hydrolase 10 isoform X2 [Clupea harengus]|uniref:Ubiquitin carboxyl-terminal hydrolase n=1 Tax=Clupea harengus TaxID=7950 RepID=A0A6P3VFM4_CLUHA|nr:ubiquitin carboxyl-terminal hydrolase 10 isoform X2 [Clupea harengus]